MTLYNPSKAWNGTTLFSDTHDPGRPRIVEVNMLGEIVWEYRLPEEIRSVADVELLPSGNILFVAPGGVYEVDRDGALVWSYADNRVSHDADRLPNGNTIMVWGGDDKVNDIQVKEVNPEGEVVWSWYARDHFYVEPYKDIYYQGWTHTNAVTRLPDGNTMISLRNFNLTVAVDPQGSVVWSYDWGSLGDSPHEPELLPNGHLLASVWSRPGPPGPNRAVEVDPETGEVVWEFRLPGIRDVDRLPNGNTLVARATKIVEVTSEGEVVWQLEVSGVSLEREDHERWFYKAERVGRVAPRFSVTSPESRIYTTSEIEVSINYLDLDLDTIWYRVYDRSDGRWATDELVYVKNLWVDALTFDRTETGVRELSLEDGDYTLYVWANSTGWGDENLYRRKVVNVANGSVDFTVRAAPFIYSVRADGEDFTVGILSNSTITGFSFDRDMKAISYTVSGPAGTLGFCNVSIPKRLLGGPYTVMVDGAVTPHRVVDTDTESYIYFTYTHSAKDIRVIGATVIPEFPSSVLVLSAAFMALILLARRVGSKNTGPV